MIFANKIELLHITNVHLNTGSNIPFTLHQWAQCSVCLLAVTMETFRNNNHYIILILIEMIIVIENE